MKTDRIAPDQWRRIQEIFHASLGLQGTERAKYLDVACGEDRSLRDEVESLLAFEDDSPQSMEPLEMVAVRALHLFDLEEEDLPTQFDLDALTGTTIAHYRIGEKLGQGGMGVVFRAEDLKLHRPLAIKFLVSDGRAVAGGAAQDGKFLERSYQEARASSTLDHPEYLHSV